MEHAKKDLIYLLIFLLALFVGWIATGGPERARQSGSSENKFQKPLEPIDSGETYDDSFKNVSPIKIEVQNKAVY